MGRKAVIYPGVSEHALRPDPTFASKGSPKTPVGGIRQGDFLGERSLARAEKRNNISGINRYIWRRGRDSNPRDGFPSTPLAGERLRPLGHLSRPMKSVRDSGLSDRFFRRVGDGRANRFGGGLFATSAAILQHLIGLRYRPSARPGFTGVRPMPLARPIYSGRRARSPPARRRPWRRRRQRRSSPRCRPGSPASPRPAIDSR